ncbi:MAG: FAD-binding protein [Legionellaceae bacterium]|nr:FAD-binding protein [Legionellaceae bacterium]
MRVLVLVEHDHAQIHPSTAHVLKAAQALGDEVILLVAGAGCSAVADQAAKLAGVTKVLLADNAAYTHFFADNLGALVAMCSEGVGAILAPATTFGKDILPRIAAKLDMAQVSDVTKIIDSDTFEHPIYAGNAIETVRVLDAIKLLSIRTTAFDAVVDEQSPCAVDVLDVAVEPSKIAFVDASSSVSERPELSSAKRVVSGGRGLQNAEQFKLIEELADALGAAVGASRAAVDAGFIANDHQVGQTGKIVAPSLYMAVGISGAIQHVAGIKDSKIIVAINKDEEAPIFQVADYALVGDLFKLVPELIEKLQA